MEMLMLIALALLLGRALAYIETQIPSTNQPLLENLRTCVFAAALGLMAISIILAGVISSQSVELPLLVFGATFFIFHLAYPKKQPQTYNAR